VVQLESHGTKLLISTLTRSLLLDFAKRNNVPVLFTWATLVLICFVLLSPVDRHEDTRWPLRRLFPPLPAGILLRKQARLALSSVDWECNLVEFLLVRSSALAGRLWQRQGGQHPDFRPHGRSTAGVRSTAARCAYCCHSCFSSWVQWLSAYVAASVRREQHAGAGRGRGGDPRRAQSAPRWHLPGAQRDALSYKSPFC
jgi:hypothetical protein